jgi:fused signal recognition particle receptor
MQKFFTNLANKLRKTSTELSSSLKNIFSLHKPSEELLEKIEESLISYDMGVNFSATVTEELSRETAGKQVTMKMVQGLIKEKLLEIFKNSSNDLSIENSKNVYTIVISGMNGGGKTTTVGKIAARLVRQGKSVLIAAADTFRPSAKEQLSKWATQAGAEMFAVEGCADPASVAFKALKKAQKEGFDVLIVDTAGRIPNNPQLMAELNKIHNVLKKIDPNAPHLNLLVIDSTIGQGAIQQVQMFQETTGIHGLIVTKLDGTARAGVMVPITQEFQLPIYFIGTGEGIEDIEKFDANNFIEALLI